MIGFIAVSAPPRPRKPQQSRAHRVGRAHWPVAPAPVAC